ncbi:MAG: 2-oxoglutarate dehydrogenase, E2 component, dihydrolipoamide succinyltransferase [Melioribacteraceae bacterium]|nr:2-oxoglutarate dehydrogenase, E2 component, dihydrolipoamide succinyltransferase [Melioribacteraceae bacterium]MCF8264330.1 2-oxoglutarate dehydrogenase, E2 component, dihydrolipoamide succinyltransferase [Melioribacteraceae bacterium]MCF8431456.1 2-oxoglutarate dehydrogenase, E2 component, dihydrolipoamide succinyltransferase [Melioribacteraceae bacterium]
MKIDVVMPKMGESINEGTLVKWHKQKGDKVERDEIIFEISTDKVDTEIPSPEAGTLVDIKVFENETVEVDTVVAIIDTDGGASVEDSPIEPREEKSDDENKVEEEKTEEIKSTTQVGGELIDIPMPKMGESVMEGTIIKWYKKVGEKIDRDETIFEISTDKVDTEVPSPEAGTLAEILVNENETVDVGTIVARVSKSGGIVKKADTAKTDQPKTDKHETTIESVKIENPEQTAKLDTSSSNKFFSPLVLNIARKENISLKELESLKGTGIGGRISKSDVLSYLKNRTEAPQNYSQPQKTDTKPRTEKSENKSGELVEVIPMDNIRKRIMYHMVNSRDTSVHVTAVLEADVSKIHNFIKANKQKMMNNDGIKLTYMPFISYAVIKALKEFPFVNATIEENNILLKKYINLGIAVAVEPNGLIVPNIKNADEKSIRGLTKAIGVLSDKSRNKGLTPDDIMDGTFTITNYGVFGSLFGTPIINQPEVGILGVGAVTKKPVVVTVDGTDSIAIKPMLYLSLSHDHRLVDGMLGGKFLKSIKDTLEKFDTNLV